MRSPRLTRPNKWTRNADKGTADRCRGLPASLHQSRESRPIHVAIDLLGWDYKGVLAYINSSALRDRVHFPGYISQSDLPLLYPGQGLCQRALDFFPSKPWPAGRRPSRRCRPRWPKILEKTNYMFKTNAIAHRCQLCHHQLSNVCFIKDRFILARCLSCGLVSVSNPPSKAEIQKLYSFRSGYHVDFVDDNSPEAQSYIAQAKYYYSQMQKYKTKGCILDIGCSAGFFLEVSRDHGWESYGVEISKDTAELDRKRAGLKIVTGTLDQGHFRSKLFDAITMWDVIEHVEDPTHMMSLIYALLKDDGIIALSTPNIDGLFPKVSYFISKFIGYWPHPEPPYHLFQFSKKTLQKLLRQTGFEILEVIDRRSPISYTFGCWNSVIRSTKKLLSSSMFLTALLLGPSIHAGDSIVVFARKAHRDETIVENF